MSRSNHDGCRAGRARCWVCKDCRQYGRRLREKESEKLDQKEQDDE